MSDSQPTPTFALDLSAQKHGPLAAQADLQVAGSPQVVHDSLLGQVVALGAQDSLSIPAPEPGKPFSIALWVKPDKALDASWATVLSVGETSGPHWALCVGGARDGLIWSDGQQPQQSLDLDRAIERGVWSHLALSYDGATLSLYVNGKLGASAALPGGLPWPDKAPLRLGAHLQSIRLQNIILPTGHPGRVNSAAFSPDGTQIVTASWDAARVWDANTGTLLRTITGHTQQVNSAAFSPDGTQIVTASNDNTARVWDARTGAPLHTFSGHTQQVNSAVFSPDGTQIVTASDTARVWDARTGDPLRTLSGHTSTVTSAAFSPDGTQIVTASWDKTARVWDARTGDPLRTLSGHTQPVNSAAFSPDGTQIVTASSDKTARVWDAKTWATLHELTGHTDKVWSAAFSPDGTQIVTTSDDNTARVWDARTGDPLRTLTGHTDKVWSAAFSPDGTQIVTASWDKTARVWDAKTWATLHELTGHTDKVRSAAFNPDGTQIVTASWDNTARVWDARTGALLRMLTGHTQQVNSAAFSPNGTQIVTASSDKTARVWDARTGALLYTLTGHPERVNSAAFSPDGTQIVTASDDHTARVWDARNGSPLHTLTGHTHGVNSAAFSPDGTQIVTASDTARVWDARIGSPLHTLSSHLGSLTSAAFSPDGTQIVTASDTARVWNAKTGILLHKFTSHSGRVTFAAFSPDGTQIVTTSQNTAQMWDAKTWATLHELTGHTDLVWSVTFRSDSARMLTVSSDKTMRDWLLSTAFIGSIAHIRLDNQALTEPHLQSLILSDLPGPVLDMKLDRVITVEGQPGKVLNQEVAGLTFKLLPEGGTVVGQAVGALDDVFGRALLFHGGDDSVSIPDLAPLVAPAGMLKPFSLELWVNPDPTLKSAFVPVLWVGDLKQLAWAIAISGTRSGLVLPSAQPGSMQWVDLTQAIPSSQWTNLTLTYDEGQLRLYVNGRMDTYIEMISGLPWSAQHALHLAGFVRDNRLVQNAPIPVDTNNLPVSTVLRPSNFLVALSPDSSRFVSILGDQVSLWDVASGQVIYTINGDGLIRSAAFSEDGKSFITINDDVTAPVKQWGVADGMRIMPLTAEAKSIESALMLSPEESKRGRLTFKVPTVADSPDESYLRKVTAQIKKFAHSYIVIGNNYILDCKSIHLFLSIGSGAI